MRAQVTVREADNAADLATPADDSPDESALPEQATTAEKGTPPSGSGSARAVYELTALVAHVLEDRGAKEKGKGKKEPIEDEGHIVAHIKVRPTYIHDKRKISGECNPLASHGN